MISLFHNPWTSHYNNVSKLGARNKLFVELKDNNNSNANKYVDCIFNINNREKTFIGYIKKFLITK